MTFFLNQRTIQTLPKLADWERRTRRWRRLEVFVGFVFSFAHRVLSLLVVNQLSIKSLCRCSRTTGLLCAQLKSPRSDARSAPRAARHAHRHRTPPHVGRCVYLEFKGVRRNIIRRVGGATVMHDRRMADFTHRVIIATSKVGECGKRHSVTLATHRHT